MKHKKYQTLSRTADGDTIDMVGITLNKFASLRHGRDADLRGSHRRCHRFPPPPMSKGESMAPPQRPHGGNLRGSHRRTADGDTIDMVGNVGRVPKS